MATHSVRTKNKIGKSYKQKLTLCTICIFTVFAVLLIGMQICQEKELKNRSMTSKLDVIADMLIMSDSTGLDASPFLPDNLRYTVMRNDGIVESESADIKGIPSNHLDRPEVQKALKYGTGYIIRESETTGLPYFYYAKRSGNSIVRIACPYNTTLRNFFRIGNMFIFIAFSLFLFTTLLLVATSNHFSRSVTNLLKLHIQNSEKGVAVFSPHRTLEYYNSKFKQYYNTIRGEAENDFDGLWSDECFMPLSDYLQNVQDEGITDQFSYEIRKSGLTFRLMLLVYPDTSFEIGIVDVTAVQENSKLKQEMTSSISHELRTPVTSILGYLETLVVNPPKDVERRKAFIKKAYNQMLRLSDLIRDVALLSKIEESPHNLPREEIDLSEICSEILEQMEGCMSERSIKVENMLTSPIVIHGNATLLTSIFRNLFENSIKYAGENITIHIECYERQDGLVYLTYYDTGKGIPEEHLARLFERFYRISDGRTRNDGGSGLGLSIVKNAVQFHGGVISATNRVKGGLQFFFTLSK